MKTDLETLQKATLFRKMRALTRTMRKGTAWRIDTVGAIRHGDQCPLTFAGRMKGSNPFLAIQSADKIGLSAFTTPIMRAADARQGRGELHSQIRRILIRA